MSDIVDRLRAWVYTATLYTTASEAAAEIERLRGDAEIARLRLNLLHDAIRRLADQDATLSVVNGDVIVQMDCQDSLQENLTLTDEEREAAKYFSQWGLWTAAQKHADALRNLLERLA
jgi:hypothetical protein